jgi:ElaB/YqjD/DUF883 family membrane-anchored ribosome-binding protein
MNNASTTTRKDSVQEAADKAKEGAAGVVDKVKDMASQAGQAVGSAATTVGHKADAAVGSVGSGMHSLGEKIHEKAPDHGVLGKAADAVANTLEAGGKYLEEKKISGMAGDVTELIRRNPIPALLVGIGLGFLLARTFRS